MFFAFAGAANREGHCRARTILAQFRGWPWGKAREAPRFTFAWIAMLVVSGAIVVTGIDSVCLVEYAIVFSGIILPFTYSRCS